MDRHPRGSFHWTVLGWAFALVLLEISKNCVILYTLHILTHIILVGIFIIIKLTATLYHSQRDYRSF